jgi:hypothetical protein
MTRSSLRSDEGMRAVRIAPEWLSGFAEIRIDQLLIKLQVKWTLTNSNAKEPIPIPTVWLVVPKIMK